MNLLTTHGSAEHPALIKLMRTITENLREFVKFSLDNGVDHIELKATGFCLSATIQVIIATQLDEANTYTARRNRVHQWKQKINELIEEKKELSDDHPQQRVIKEQLAALNRLIEKNKD